MTAPALPTLFDGLFRHHYATMVAGLVRVFGPSYIDLAEDLVQEAMMRALKTWPYEGVPERPEAWLRAVARNLALDAARHRSVSERVENELRRWAAREADGHELPEHIEDDQLRMIFTCCHPSIAAGPRLALTLKTLCGFSVPEIARALLLKEATVAQRLTRAKARVQREGVCFDIPQPRELDLRLDSVLEVIYLVFNEGYAAHGGDALVRRDLVEEAVRLASLLLTIPETGRPKVHAMLALLLFLGARIPARIGSEGELVILARQDRSLWNRSWLSHAWHHYRESIQGDELTPYHVEAAIAAEHAMAARYEDTKWETILQRYDQLEALAPSPLVTLNRSVAIYKLHGAEAALGSLEKLSGAEALARYHLLPTTRGLFLWAQGRRDEACSALARALELARSEAERKLLDERLRSCRAGEPAPLI